MLKETQTRVYVAHKALALGRGGISTVAELPGLSRPTIPNGLKELRAGMAPETAVMLRKQGGGRQCEKRLMPPSCVIWKASWKRTRRASR